MDLTVFHHKNLFEAGTDLFRHLNIRLNSNTTISLDLKAVLKDHFKAKEIFSDVTETYFLGLVDDSVFDMLQTPLSFQEADKKINNDYNGLMVFAVKLNDNKKTLTRSDIADLTRAFNRASQFMPVVLLVKYGNFLTFSTSERMKYQQTWRPGEKIGKVSMLKDIDILKTHAGHLRILEYLIKKSEVKNFNGLYEQWKQVFNIQILNKRFYEEISSWYFWALKYVKFPQIRPSEDLIDDKIHQSQSLIRLLTRLLFCWFMKEKGLIKSELFKINKLKDILKNFQGLHSEETVYYKAILQNLFFATLSKPISERKLIKDIYPNPEYGDPLVYRYAELFENENNILKHFENIPFLNGGLFDCLDQKKDKENSTEIRLDGFSTIKTKQPVVPDKLFFGEYKDVDLSSEYAGKKKIKVTVNGLIDIFDSYKFTIEENTPIEEDIALDPELLGRVFENLLASYNPETQITARNETGSFYTPREIVHYMVDESLISFFKQKLSDAGIKGNTEERLRELFSYEETNPFSDEKENTVIIQALENLKSLDPACGSGAFPMGVLHKLVWILRKVDPENKKWFESLISRLPEYTQAEMRKKLEGENWDYIRKLGIIQQSVYGVDIQPIAIQIAKLRFFISLIVDQKIRSTPENNFGLLPLPNLDFKLVCANTLIGAPEDFEKEDGGIAFEDDDTFFKKFNALTNKYFSAYLPKEKKKVSNEIKELVSKKAENKMAEAERQGTYNVDARYSKHVAEKYKSLIDQKKQNAALWNSYTKLFKHESVGFFDTKYFFPEVRNGFDIVIGNPPYIQLQKEGGKLANQYKNCGYKSFERTGDIYSLFYESGINNLKTGGHLCFITSNKWMRAGYGKSLRKLFNSYNPLLLVDLGPGIFESATVDTNILIIGKDNNQGRLAGVTLNAEAKDAVLSDFINKNKSILPKMGEDAWIIGNQAEQNLKEKIEGIGKLLKDWDVNIYRGVVTGLNEAFIIDTATRDRLVAEEPKSAEILKPILRGRDIKRYGHEWAGLWIIFIPWHFPLHKDDSIQGASKKAENELQKQYPAIYKHLLQFKDALLKRNKDETGIRYEWYALQRCAATYYPEFEKEKVVYPNMTKYLPFIYDVDGYYTNQKCFILTSKKYLKYLTGYFNSSISQRWIRSNCPELQGGTRELSKVFFENIPIPSIMPANKSIVGQIERIVEKILSAKKQNPKADTSQSEREIDRLVYKLYELTEEEIAIVEGKR